MYELILAKEAIVMANSSLAESKGHVALFEEVLNQPDPSDDLRKLIDTLSSTTTKREIYRSCIDDSFIYNRRLGCRIFLW
ncbi:chitin elicitor receptor kinase 1-like [Olea europaea var. sylvestris]|uniref:chitin elicitor receptor kinase 1-like n=1 Tax=Olea europaea var. sylvestris TaxID=158386 RepID=UPI000C1D1901|nr:chitin elicitor receptor kinase 1-like [Olea europaea var. sylvestris]